MKKTKAKTKEKLSIEKFWGGWNIAEATILMVAGILGIIVGAISIANKDNQDMQNVATTMGNIIPFVTGLFVCMDAVMRIILSFTKFQKETDESAMLIGAFEMTVGIILMIFFRNFTELVADFVAIFMICIGVLLVIFSIYTITKRKAKIFIPILEIIFASLLIGVGVAILVIYYQDNGDIARQRLVLIITGAILFISGVAFMIMTVVTRKKQIKEQKEEEAKALLEKQQEEEKKLLEEPKKKRKGKKAKDDDVIDFTEDEPKALEHNDDENDSSNDIIEAEEI